MKSVADCNMLNSRRGGRVVEGAALEKRYAGDRIAGSNPALSARFNGALGYSSPAELVAGNPQLIKEAENVSRSEGHQPYSPFRSLYTM